MWELTNNQRKEIQDLLNSKNDRIEALETLVSNLTYDNESLRYNNDKLQCDIKEMSTKEIFNTKTIANLNKRIDAKEASTSLLLEKLNEAYNKLEVLGLVGRNNRISTKDFLAS